VSNSFGAQYSNMMVSESRNITLKGVWPMVAPLLSNTQVRLEVDGLIDGDVAWCSFGGVNDTRLNLTTKVCAVPTHHRL